MGSWQMDQPLAPPQDGCTLWAAVGWGEGAGDDGEGDGGVDGGVGGGAFRTSDAPAAAAAAAAERTCVVGGGAVVAPAAVGTCPGTGFLVGGCNRQANLVTSAQACINLAPNDFNTRLGTSSNLT